MGKLLDYNLSRMEKELISMPYEVPYWDIDENMIRLVKALNDYPGVTTLGCCGGHENPSPIQHPLGHWFVTFRIAHTRGGWRSLELIASVPPRFSYRNKLGKYKKLVKIEIASSHPGYTTGRGLFFSLSGRHVEPDAVAEFVDRLRSALT